MGVDELSVLAMVLHTGADTTPHCFIRSGVVAIVAGTGRREIDVASMFRVLKPGGTFLIVNEADGYGFLDNLYPKIIKGMTLYKTEELSAILTKAGFTNIEIDTKLGCVTVSARRPVTALDKVKTAVRFDNVRKWGRAALFAAGTAAAVCTATCLLKKNKKQ